MLVFILSLLYDYCTDGVVYIVFISSSDGTTTLLCRSSVAHNGVARVMKNVLSPIVSTKLSDFGD